MVLQFQPKRGSLQTTTLCPRAFDEPSASQIAQRLNVRSNELGISVASQAVFQWQYLGFRNVGVQGV